MQVTKINTQKHELINNLAMRWFVCICTDVYTVRLFSHKESKRVLNAFIVVVELWISKP